MTDYLALALAQEETGQEEGETPELAVGGLAVGVSRPASGKVPSRGEADLKEAEGAAAAGEAVASLLVRTPFAGERPWKGRGGALPEEGGGGIASVGMVDPTGRLWARGAATESPLDLPLASGGAPAIAEPSGAAWLRRLARTAEAAGYVRDRRGGLALLAPEEASLPAMGAEELDRAVERDARRYGGGFELY
ncbi:hypothetical protein CE91St43_25990 [Oscillospiraceae bacterium]|nr:hypothetical protein CE91St43_25990 [Oscillospiraceae bacterium]